MAWRPGRVLISQEEIAARVADLGASIGRDYAGRAPVLVVVLKGAVTFAADLARAIPLPVSTDYIGVSTYGSGMRSSGVVRLSQDLSMSIEGRDVIVVPAHGQQGRAVPGPAQGGQVL